MSPLFKLHLRVFLITGLGYALIISVTDIFRGKPFEISIFLMHAIGFGLIMSLSLVILHTSSLEDLGVTEFTKENLSVKQKRHISSSISPGELVSKIEGDKYFKRGKINTEEEYIQIIMPMTWKSFGERIEIHTEQINEGMTQYFVSSRNKGITPLVDYGRNMENVLKIENLLT